MRDEYSDEETPKLRRGSSKSTSSKKHRKAQGYSDDSNDSDASRGRSKIFMKNKSSQRREGRYLTMAYSDSDGGSDECQTVKRRSERTKLTKKRGKRLTETSDDDNSVESYGSVEYEYRRGRRKSSKNKATTRSCDKRKLADDYSTEDSSNSSFKYAPTSRHHSHTSSKRKRASKELSTQSAKRQRKSLDTYRCHNTHGSESAQSQTIGSSSSVSLDISSTSSQLSSDSTKSSSLYHTNKPVKEVVITQTRTLRTHNRHNKERVLLEIQRTKLIEEYAYLYSSNRVIMEKMPQMLHHLRNMQNALIEKGSTLVDMIEGPMELVKKEQELLMLKSSFMSDSYEGILSSAPALAAASNPYNGKTALYLEYLFAFIKIVLTCSVFY